MKTTLKNQHAKLTIIIAKMIDTNPNYFGIIMILISGIGFVSMGVLMRTTMDTGYHPAQVAFMRGLGGIIFCIPVCYSIWKTSTTWRCLIPGNYWLLLGRAIFAGFAISTSSYALSQISLSEFTAISFITPILLTIAAALIFNESVGIRRIMAVLIGFAGVYLLLDPQHSGMNLGKWSALAFVTSAAIAQIFGKILSKTTPVTIIILYATLGMTIVAGILAIPYWQPISFEAYLFAIAMGLMGHIGQWTFTKGLAIGEVSVIMPFDYVRLLYSVIAGYVLFFEMPSGNLWIGSTLIIGATLYTSMRERKLHRERTLQTKKQSHIK